MACFIPFCHEDNADQPARTSRTPVPRKNLRCFLTFVTLFGGQLYPYEAQRPPPRDPQPRSQSRLTAVAGLSLALGIGVNTAIFTVIDALLLKTLLVEEPGRLVMASDPAAAGVSIGTQTGERSLFTCEEFARIRDRNQPTR
jgi:hypothetical protein